MLKKITALVMSAAMIFAMIPVLGGVAYADDEGGYWEVSTVDHGQPCDVTFFEGTEIVNEDFVLYHKSGEHEEIDRVIDSDHFRIAVYDEDWEDVTEEAAEGSLELGCYYVGLASSDEDIEEAVNYDLNICDRDSLYSYTNLCKDGEVYDIDDLKIYLSEGVSKYSEIEGLYDWELRAFTKNADGTYGWVDSNATCEDKLYLNDGGNIQVVEDGEIDMSEYYGIKYFTGNDEVWASLVFVRPVTLWFNGNKYTRSGHVSCGDDGCEAYWDAENCVLTLDNCSISNSCEIGDTGVKACLAVTGGSYMTEVQVSDWTFIGTGEEDTVAVYVAGEGLAFTGHSLDFEISSGICDAVRVEDSVIAFAGGGAQIGGVTGIHLIDSGLLVMQDNIRINAYNKLNGSAVAGEGDAEVGIYNALIEAKAYGKPAFRGIEDVINLSNHKIAMDIGENDENYDSQAYKGDNNVRAHINDDNEYVRLYNYDMDLRLAGNSRYDTALLVADELKERMGVDEFECVVVAYGGNYADALTGGYLAYVNNAPIILVDSKTENMIAKYISENLAEEGQVYILGGTGAVPQSFEKKVKALDGNYSVKRLGGKSRYETNMMILDEAGAGGEPLLVCSASGYADSLGASATGHPILLAGNSLSNDQQKFIREYEPSELYIIGGTGAVNTTVEKQLNTIANKQVVDLTRIAGATRYDTSRLIAEEFIFDPDMVVLTYAKNFPDGLSGGVLALTLGAPLLLADNTDKGISTVRQYVGLTDIETAITLGGKKLISDEAVDKIMGRQALSMKSINKAVQKMK